jgi:hypothetical protein
MQGGNPQIIRIALWNANGLQNHKDELTLFLTQNKIDVMLISENHFTSKSHFTIPGYVTCTTNPPADKDHGGTAILIKRSIAYTELPRYAKPELQASIINVQGPHRTIIIAATYCIPRYNLKVSSFETFFLSLEKRFVVGREINSKHSLWGSRLDTTKGRELATVIQKRNCAIMTTGTLTYWLTDTHKFPDLLDFFIISGLFTTYADIQPSYDLPSDHSPIITTLSTIAYQNKPTARLHNSRTNWDTYKAKVCNLLNENWKLKSHEDIDAAVIQYTNALSKAAIEATPIASPRRTHTTSNSNVTNLHPSNYLLSHIKHLVALKRKARTQWQKMHSPESRHK